MDPDNVAVPAPCGCGRIEESEGSFSASCDPSLLFCPEWADHFEAAVATVAAERELLSALKSERSTLLAAVMKRVTELVLAERYEESSPAVGRVVLHILRTDGELAAGTPCSERGGLWGRDELG